MYAIPTGLDLDLLDNIRFVVISKSEGLFDAICLQALGKLAGYFYLSQFSNGVYEQIAKERSAKETFLSSLQFLSTSISLAC
jgi:hypothetical protein